MNLKSIVSRNDGDTIRLQRIPDKNNKKTELPNYMTFAEGKIIHGFCIREIVLILCR
jgi:hypothetical protein